MAQTLTQDDIDVLKTIFATKDDLDQKLDQQKEEILTGMADFFHNNLLPTLDDHENRLERLETREGLPPLPVPPKSS